MREEKKKEQGGGSCDAHDCRQAAAKCKNRPKIKISTETQSALDACAWRALNDYLQNTCPVVLS